VELVTIFYRLRFETSLFVAFYESQGYGGGIRPRLHTAVSCILLNSWNKGFLEKVTDAKLVKGSPSVVKTQRFITMTTKADNGPYPEADEVSPYFYTIFL
jgi:hypothetical protein